MSEQCAVCLGKLGACDTCDAEGVCVRVSFGDVLYCARCRGSEVHAFEADEERCACIDYNEVVGLGTRPARIHCSACVDRALGGKP